MELQKKAMRAYFSMKSSIIKTKICPKVHLIIVSTCEFWVQVILVIKGLFHQSVNM